MKSKRWVVWVALKDGIITPRAYTTISSNKAIHTALNRSDVDRWLCVQEISEEMYQEFLKVFPESNKCTNRQ